MRIYEKPDIQIKTFGRADIITFSTVSDPYDFNGLSSAKQFGGITDDFDSAE